MICTGFYNNKILLTNNTRRSTINDTHPSPKPQKAKKLTATAIYLMLTVSRQHHLVE